MKPINKIKSRPRTKKWKTQNFDNIKSTGFATKGCCAELTKEVCMLGCDKIIRRSQLSWRDAMVWIYIYIYVGVECREDVSSESFVLL